MDLVISLFLRLHQLKMKLTALAASIAALALSLTNEVNASPTSKDGAATKFQIARLAAEIQRRANPTGSYAPSFGTCPTANGNVGLIRNSSNHAVSNQEAAYVNQHRTGTQSTWQTWLSSNPGPNLNGANGIPGGVQNYTSNVANLPRVGIALSGGGYRAMVSHQRILS